METLRVIPAAEIVTGMTVKIRATHDSPQEFVKVHDVKAGRRLVQGDTVEVVTVYTGKKHVILDARTHVEVVKEAEVIG